MTARKTQRTRRVAPPGWHQLQDAARMFGISPNTMTKWVTSGFVHVSHPDGQRPLVSAGEARRVLRLMRELGREP